jgi:hypothetical protein
MIVISGISIKVCRSCGILKKLSEYYVNMGNVCKECKKARSIKWKHENRDRANATDRKWREQHRERSNAHSSKWRSNNKDKHLKLCRAWNAANKERCHDNLVRWKKENPGRLAEWYRIRWKKTHSGPCYSQKEWTALLKAFGNKCLSCGIIAADTTKGFLVPDHVIPVCKDGSNTIDNIQPLCFDCNRKKNGRTIDYRVLIKDKKSGSTRKH